MPERGSSFKHALHVTRLQDVRFFEKQGLSACCTSRLLLSLDLSDGTVQMQPLSASLILYLGGRAKVYSRVDLLAVLVEANTNGGRTVPASNTGADTDDVCVNGARHTVVELDVELGQGVLCEKQQPASVARPPVSMERCHSPA